MATIIDDLLGSELSLLFLVSTAVWILILVYIFYINNRMNKLQKELRLFESEERA
ncbi:MAG: CcmD family protein [Candidatus Heimdallarchaeota archaeon]